jgi:hypothetical protein
MRAQDGPHLRLQAATETIGGVVDAEARRIGLAPGTASNS